MFEQQQPEKTQIAGRAGIKPAAYQAYLRGLNYSQGEITERDVRFATEMFQKAVDLDPNFAVGYAELARMQTFMYFIVDHTPQRLAMAKAALDRAFQLKPGLPEGHVALGFYYYRGLQDYEHALNEWKLAEKTGANNIWALLGEGTVYRRQGKFKEALRAEQKALSMNPRDPHVAQDIGVTYSTLRDYPEAQRYFDLTISLGPDRNDGYYYSAFNHLNSGGSVQAAIDILNNAPDITSPDIVKGLFLLNLYDRNYKAALQAIEGLYSDPPRKLLNQGLAYSYLKDLKRARLSFEGAVVAFQKRIGENPIPQAYGWLGIAYAGMGKKDEAIRAGQHFAELIPVSKDAVWGPDALEKLAQIYTMVGEQEMAIQQLKYLLSVPSELNRNVLRIDPRWDPLHGNPKFQKLVGEN